MTDTYGGYHRLGKEFARHEMVDTAPTNTFVAMPTQTPSKAISRPSSAASLASITTSRKPT